MVTANRRVALVVLGASHKRADAYRRGELLAFAGHCERHTCGMCVELDVEVNRRHPVEVVQLLAHSTDDLGHVFAGIVLGPFKIVDVPTVIAPVAANVGRDGETA
jgi:hypothetical protein